VRCTRKTIDILAFPVTWRPHPEQVAAAQRGHEDWSQSLDWVRDGLLPGGMRRDFEMPGAMQKSVPWLATKFGAINR